MSNILYIDKLIKNIIFENKYKLKTAPFKLRRGWKILTIIEQEEKRIFLIMHTKTKTLERIAILYKVI